MAVSTENKTTVQVRDSSTIASTQGRLSQAYRVAGAQNVTPTIRNQASPQADPNKFSRDLDSIQNAIGRVAQDTYALNDSLVDEMASDDTAMMVQGLIEMDKSLKPGESRANIINTAGMYRADLIAKKGDFGGNKDMQARYREKFINPSGTQAMSYIKKWQGEEHGINGEKAVSSANEFLSTIAPHLGVDPTTGIRSKDGEAQVKEMFKNHLDTIQLYGVEKATQFRLSSAKYMTSNLVADFNSNYQELMGTGPKSLLNQDKTVNKENIKALFEKHSSVYATVDTDKDGVQTLKFHTNDTAVREEVSDQWARLNAKAEGMIGEKTKQDLGLVSEAAKWLHTIGDSSELGIFDLNKGNLINQSNEVAEAYFKDLVERRGLVYDQDAQEVFWKARASTMSQDSRTTYSMLNTPYNERNKGAVFAGMSKESRAKVLESDSQKFMSNFHAGGETRERAINSFENGNNYYLNGYIGDTLFKGISDAGVTSQQSLEFYKQYRPLLDSQTYRALNMQTKDGQYRNAISTAMKYHVDTGKEQKFAVTPEVNTMIKNYIYSGTKDEQVAKIFSNNSDYLENTVEEAKSLPYEMRQEAIQEAKIRLLITGGSGQVPGESASAINLLPVEESTGTFKNDTYLSEMVRQDPKYRTNIDWKVADAIYRSGNGDPQKQAVANLYLEAAKRDGNKYSLVATSIGGVYAIHTRDESENAVATGINVDFRGWDGSAPAGAGFGVNRKKRPASSAIEENHWEGTAPSGFTGFGGDTRANLKAAKGL